MREARGADLTRFGKDRHANCRRYLAPRHAISICIGYRGVPVISYEVWVNWASLILLIVGAFGEQHRQTTPIFPKFAYTRKSACVTRGRMGFFFIVSFRVPMNSSRCGCSVSRGFHLVDKLS